MKYDLLDPERSSIVVALDRNYRSMKKRLFAVLRVLLVLAISFVVAGVVVVDRYAWKPARRLSAAVRDARSVTLEESLMTRSSPGE